MQLHLTDTNARRIAALELQSIRFGYSGSRNRKSPRAIYRLLAATCYNRANQARRAGAMVDANALDDIANAAWTMRY